MLRIHKCDERVHCLLNSYKRGYYKLPDGTPSTDQDQDNLLYLLLLNAPELLPAIVTIGTHTGSAEIEQGGNIVDFLDRLCSDRIPMPDFSDLTDFDSATQNASSIGLLYSELDYSTKNAIDRALIPVKLLANPTKPQRSLFRKLLLAEINR